MKKNLILLNLLVAAGLVANPAFANGSSQDKAHSHSHEHKAEKASNDTFAYAYTAIYSLKAGTTYTISVGHTHEKHLHLGFVKSVAGLDARVAGNAVFASKEVEVKNNSNFAVASGAFYELELGHHESTYTFTVPEDGKYILFADSPSSDYLPYDLKVAAEVVLPSYKHTISDVKSEIYNGYFADDLIKDRALSDWEGNWQSIYPLLLDGTLDPVWAKKAASSTTMDAKQYKEYYDAGYKTDVAYILIQGDKVTFTKENGEKVVGTYVYDGKTTLNYAKGNRGVRFQFKQVDPNSKAPKFIQFSDHNIYPTKVGHFHIFWGNTSQAEVNKELVNWPTYYPASYSKKEILDELLHH